MGHSEALFEQLSRSNRRWKTLALTACTALILTAVLGSFALTTQQFRVQAERRHAMDALARAESQAAQLRQAK